jgi:hypothetical protein
VKSFIPPKEENISIPHLVRALNDETYDQHVLSGENLKKIIGHLPKWITYPDADRVPWRGAVQVESIPVDPRELESAPGFNPRAYNAISWFHNSLSGDPRALERAWFQTLNL